MQSPMRQLNQKCEAVVSGTPGNRLVGVVVFNGFALQEMAEVVEAFQVANTRGAHAGNRPAPYQIVLLSSAGGRVASESSVFVWTERAGAFAQKTHFHAVFVMTGSGPQAPLSDTRLADWFARTCPHGQRLYACARGRQWLTDAGLRAPACEAPPVASDTNAGQLFAGNVPGVVEG